MTTLLSLVEALARDPDAKADYAAAPDAYLERHGFGDLTPAEVNEAVIHSANTLPPPVAAQMTPHEGLSSVADVDPEAFHDGFAHSYEDDLFGHDDAGFDDDVGLPVGFDDDPDPPAEGAQLGALDGTDDGDDASADGHHLFGLSDPHGLDEFDDGPPGPTVGADRAGDEAAGGEDAPESAARLGHDDLSPGDDDPFAEGSADQLGEPGGVGDGDGFEAALAANVDGSALIDDPFSNADPLASSDEPWYQSPVTTSYDVEIDEPESDILDDVDDIHVTGN